MHTTLVHYGRFMKSTENQGQTISIWKIAIEPNVTLIEFFTR